MNYIRNNVSFGAELTYCSMGKIKVYDDRWKGITEQFNAETKNECEDTALELLEVGNYDKYLIISKRSKKNRYDIINATIESSAYNKLMKLDDDGIVDKLKSIMKVTNSNNEELEADCEKLSQKHDLKPESRLLLQDVIKLEKYSGVEKHFKDDSILKDIHFCE